MCRLRNRKNLFNRSDFYRPLLKIHESTSHTYTEFLTFYIGIIFLIYPKNSLDSEMYNFHFLHDFLKWII